LKLSLNLRLRRSAVLIVKSVRLAINNPIFGP
jgi:hypothetical protein